MIEASEASTSPLYPHDLAGDDDRATADASDLDDSESYFLVGELW
jgi:hypothetical protein